MPGAWTEPAIEGLSDGIVAKHGRGHAVPVPRDWPIGTRVKVLRLPDANEVPP